MTLREFELAEPTMWKQETRHESDENPLAVMYKACEGLLVTIFPLTLPHNLIMESLHRSFLRIQLSVEVSLKGPEWCLHLLTASHLSQG